MFARDGLHADVVDASVEPAVLVGQVLREIMIELVAARLGGEHQGEGGIARDIDRLERIHLDGDAQCHVSLTPFRSP